MRLRVAPLVAILAAALAGCASGRKTYPDPGTRNLEIRTATQASSVFSSVRAELDIHGVDADCRTQYLGTIDLDKPSVSAGIPAGRWSYLVFEFATSGFLGGSRGRISRETALKALPGHRYEAEVTYREEIYNVVLRERAPSGAARELPLRPAAKPCS